MRVVFPLLELPTMEMIGIMASFPSGRSHTTIALKGSQPFDSLA
jgi:hypothetical protein